MALDLTSEKFAEVRGVILDPSCSGSGTAHSRMDHLLPSQGAVHPDQQVARLQSLAAFQVLHVSCVTPIIQCLLVGVVLLPFDPDLATWMFALRA